jgi:hypothetical protein
MSSARAPLGAAPLRRAQPDSPTGRLPFAALALVLAGSVLALMVAGRDTTFFFDDWDFVTQRRDWNLHVLLFPHNEHLSAVPVFVYKVLFETVGLDDYGIFRLLLAGLNALVGLLLFVYAAPRVGRWIAVGVVAVLVFMGPAHQDLLWAFQIGFLISLASGLGALLALERRTRRGDVAAAVLLLVALGSSSLGVPLLGAAIVELAWRREDRPRLLWVVAAPVVLYGAWYLKYGKSAAKAENIADVPGWIVNAASGAAGAITGLGGAYGPTVVLILAFFAARAFVVEERPRARLVAVIALPLAFWAATALARADMGVKPDESRYLYPGGLFLALVAVELARGRAIAPRVTAFVVAALGFGAVMNANGLEPGGDGLRAQAMNVRGSVTALELLGPRAVPAAAQPDPVQVQIKAAPYFAAVRDYGSSPAYSVRELDRLPEPDAGQVDVALARLGGIGVAAGGAPSADEPAPAAVAQRAVRTTPAGSCLRVAPAGGSPEAVVVPSDGTVAVVAGTAKVEIRVTRFADAVPETGLGEVAPGATSTVQVKPDRSRTPWRVSLRSTAAFRACSSAG